MYVILLLVVTLIMTSSIARAWRKTDILVIGNGERKPTFSYAYVEDQTRMRVPKN